MKKETWNRYPIVDFFKTANFKAQAIPQIKVFWRKYEQQNDVAQKKLC